MKSKCIAKAVIFNLAGQVLLMRRSQTDTRRPGEWDYPGGGVEAGEDFTAAVQREIQEEAGLDIPFADLRLIYTATEIYEPTNESVIRLLFTAKLASEQEVKLSFEHDEHKWVEIDTALSEFPHPFYATGLRYARDHGLL